MDEMQKIREFANSKHGNLFLSVKFYPEIRYVEQSDAPNIQSNQVWCAEIDGEDLSLYVYGASYDYMLNKLRDQCMLIGYSG